MKALLYIFSVLLMICGTVETTHAQVLPQTPTLEAKRWKDSQLIEPAVLAGDLKANTFHGVIFNVGPMEDISGAKHMGQGKDDENIDKLRKEVASLPKNAEIIIYCGCCPLESKCPNARPAFDELIKQGFTNVKVLDLATNLKTNWIDEGYPLAGK
jgi:hypothetical protein